MTREGKPRTQRPVNRKVARKSKVYRSNAKINLTALRNKLPLNDSDQLNEAEVEEWVYRFLGSLAAIEADKNQSINRKPIIRFAKIKKNAHKPSGYRRFRSPTPYSWDRVTPRSSVSALQHPTNSASSDENDNVDELPQKTRYEYLRSQDENLHENHTMLEKINHYIKAGISEGKRRAKNYIRNALSFALEMGYLIPADPEGKFLRVSPAFVNQVKSAAKAQEKNMQRVEGRVYKSSTAKNRRTTRRLREDEPTNDDRLVQMMERSEETPMVDVDNTKKMSNGETSSDTRSEESRENIGGRGSRGSSRSSKALEEVNKMKIRTSSADVVRKPTLCLENLRPSSVNCTANMDVHEMMDQNQ